MAEPRLQSGLWVAAYIRRVNAALSGGPFAAVLKRGAEEAGAIFLLIEDEKSNLQLFIPAPQTEQPSGTSRLFQPRQGAREDILAYIEKEKAFDPDFWLVGVEDKEGRHFLNDDEWVP